MAKIIRNDKGTTNVPKISECVEAFILSRRTQNCTFQTIRFYQKKLPQIVAWLEAENITRFEEISPTDIRIYLDQLRESGHNKGGTHIFYRVLKAYLRWVWDEYDLTIRNPIDKIRCETPRSEPIPGITIEEVNQMIEVCRLNKFPERDRAMIAILTDTGIRRSELMNLTISDVDCKSGRIVVRHGKGDKFHVVFCGKEARKYLRQYLSCLADTRPNDPLWLTFSGDPLSTDGALSVLRRTMKNANLGREYSFHAFRRCFAIECVRNGDDLGSVSRKLNHSSLEVTKRYLAFTEDDDRAFALRASPMDNRRKRQI